MAKRWILISIVALVVAVTAAYANHFGNAFQFDDSHTVVNNVYIRDLGNVGKFFSDARTSTPNPENQIYRPLVTLSLAVDYALGNGLKPFWFHLSTFLWFLVLLGALVVLYRQLIARARGDGARGYDALVAVAIAGWFGLHPVGAETVNYVYQRGDLYSTLGVVAAVVLYARYPARRRFGLYLLPAIVGMLAKQSAMMFAPLILVYSLYFETEHELDRTAIVTAVKRAIPAFVVAAIYYFFQKSMTSPTWTSGSSEYVRYWATQPGVILHYAVQAVLPISLSADTDRKLVPRMLSDDVVIGVAFLVILAVISWRTSRAREQRPIAFGLWWFLITLAPTSLKPFAEVENDHRMFMPFVGLLLAIGWGLALFVERCAARTSSGTRLRTVVPVAVVALLVGYGAGTVQRNRVWHTNASLWRDVAAKSPGNGRGLVNYGVALMQKGRVPEAIQLFLQASRLTPNYYLVYVNLGVAYGVIGKDAEAEQNFQRAMQLAPQHSGNYHYYARWLHRKQRDAEAVAVAKQGVSVGPADIEGLAVLMQIYFDTAQMQELRALVESSLQRFPKERRIRRYETLMTQHPNGPGARPSTIAEAEALVKQSPTAEALVELSLQYALAGKHRESIKSAQLALKQNDHLMAAHHNVVAGYIALEEWDLAIQNAQIALQIDPDHEAIKQNLAWAQSQRGAVRLQDIPLLPDLP